MADLNKNTYRIIAIQQFADKLKLGEEFHITECVDFLNTRKAIRTNKINRSTQTDSRQLPMLLRTTGMFTSLGKGQWRFDSTTNRRIKNER